MLEFTPMTMGDIPRLRPYYETCAYRLCEYSAGTKLMWRDYLHPAYALAAGCLVIRNEIAGATQFDFPIPGPDGDVETALRMIEYDCTEKGIRPVISVVPEEKAQLLALRYPCVSITNERAWKDYLYHADDLAQFAGRRYSGQRNHINKFKKEYPGAAFIRLSEKDDALMARFWADYEAEFHKESEMAAWELGQAQELFTHLGSGAFRAGGILYEGRLLAVSLAEKCGQTLVCHIEKALYSYTGVYPMMVQSFAAACGSDCTWINREDDGRDSGLRTSKLQYLPAELGSKMHFAVGCELDAISEIPALETERLTLTALGEGDRDAYNALCLDDQRNRWWGYDYRKDLQGELTADYFLAVAQADFARRLAVNFAVRLDGQLIGEAVLYNGDWRGTMELGCRIAPAYAGHGYGREAFTAAAEWALYRLGLARVMAKCFRENEASYQMLSSCMRQAGEDETYFYFEKLV